jgi:23S rRNA (cytosine1962-C5)-methyltransferase
MNERATLRLKTGRDRSLRRHHPWIMSGSVDRVLGDPQPGDTVIVVDEASRPMALASYSPHSSIRARVWAFDVQQSIDDGFVAARITAAAERRRHLGIADGDAVRLVFGEADGLPGLRSRRSESTDDGMLSSRRSRHSTVCTACSSAVTATIDLAKDLSPPPVCGTDHFLNQSGLTRTVSAFTSMWSTATRPASTSTNATVVGLLPSIHAIERC